jgi:hypothetical protein
MVPELPTMTVEQRCSTLDFALRQYRATACDAYDETLSDIISRVEIAGSLGKSDLGALLLWKRIRIGPWATKLLSTPETGVRKTTGNAVAAARDTELRVPDAARLARQALLDLPGAQTGDAFASAVILVGAPDRMAVYDYHAHLGLWRVGLRLHAGPGLYHRYMGLIEQCRTELLAHGHGQWTGRDVDLALLTHGQHRGLPRPKPWRQR